jgi:hypothetical protein
VLGSCLVAASTTTTTATSETATSTTSTTALTIAVGITNGIIAVAVIEELVVAITTATAAVGLESATPVAVTAVANTGAFLRITNETTILNAEKFARNTTAYAALISNLGAMISETITVKLAHYFYLYYMLEKNRFLMF